ncbi:hypothetical protein DEH69_19665 [Streptomyces sp. PT12]|nr:hypothetical protein DEH69_19665 [Streptomyces sp. PT12]
MWSPRARGSCAALSWRCVVLAPRCPGAASRLRAAQGHIGGDGVAGERVVDEAADGGPVRRVGLLVHDERRDGLVVVAPGARARDVHPAARATVLPRRLVQGWYLPDDVRAYAPGAFPVFDRVGDVTAYGFPTVDGATVKIGIYTAGHPVVHDTDHVPLTVGRGLLDHFHATVSRFFPGLHPDPVATTVGVEGYTTDGQPLLGPAPGTPRILLACGFSGAGFKFAPAIGDVLADLVDEGGTARDVRFLAPDRPLAPWPPEALTPA